jgi:DNA primase small subunit
VLGFSSNVAATLIKNKEAILKSFDDAGRLNAIKGLGFETWKRMAESCVASQSAKIDTVVTTDVHRLIRLANTLHGKTGFKVVKIAIDDLDAFDPLRDAVVLLADPVKVTLMKPVTITMKDETFQLAEGEQELPTFLAIFLVGRKEATI